MKTIITIAVLAVVFTAANANAQTVDYAAEGAVANVAVTGFYGGGFYPGWGNGGGTVQGSVLRGAADLVRAEGDNAYMNSLANINNQVALKKNIENREQWVETYFQMRRTNDAYRASQRPAPTSLGQAQQMARMMAPQRLNSYQLEPVTGKINWPAALQGDQFALARRQLERLFAARDAQTAGVGSATDANVNAITSQMREELKSQINTMSPSEYLVAKKFIDGLGYEARFAPGVEGLAAK
jgi:hypothetical protein